jgi:hypothetical protein
MPAQAAAVVDHLPSSHTTLEDALERASSVAIYGIAPRAVLEAMQRVARRASENGDTPPWRQILYVTPDTRLIFPNRGLFQLGTVVQQWTSALTGIRNCVRQVQSDQGHEPGSGDASLSLELLATSQMYLGVILVIAEESASKERLWVSVGPSGLRQDTIYVAVEQGSELFERVMEAATLMRHGSQAIVSRQLGVSPEGLDKEVPRAFPDIEVKALVPVGDPMPPGSCLPAAVLVLRAATAGHPVVLLKRRTRFTDADDFDRLSLISGRVLEEDLAAALDVPLFTDRDADRAIDAMWIQLNRAEPLAVPRAAFVKAAQREVFIATGLDIPEDRFVYRGYQLVEREGSRTYLFFCVLEVVLQRTPVDEVDLAESWNPEQLVRREESLLYGPGFETQLNRFLITGQGWLRDRVFSHSTDMPGTTSR